MKWFSKILNNVHARLFSFKILECPLPPNSPCMLSSVPLLWLLTFYECSPEDLGKINFGVLDPYLAELFAARDAISVVISKSLPRIIVEGDAEVVIRQQGQDVVS
ncbi:unnamed protein product [Linum trigynum]|uniref:RNase H type-1 domain-containing protein n=1 Tax=Linum trigynum TaxID=586398 RepID=A0AAV2EDP7_9ROSI